MSHEERPSLALLIAATVFVAAILLGLILQEVYPPVDATIAPEASL